MITTNKNKKEIFVLLFILLLACVSFSQAALDIPPDVLAFYSQNITSLIVSNDSLLMFDNDRASFYFMYFNHLNTTVNVTSEISCISKGCPSEDTVIFDFTTNDSTPKSVKKAVGVFVTTNMTKLGIYTYNVSVVDKESGFEQYASIQIEVLSPSFFRQFLHNLFRAVMFWR